MTIIITDPQIYLPTQDGAISNPLVKDAAGGSSEICGEQRGAVIGQVVPLVFGRRVGATGGVLIAPPATEARFENDVGGDVTAYYHLILSDGQIGSIQVRDIFQCSCRVGDFSQTYNKRAGDFIQGNFITDPDIEAPYFCGTGGTYSGLSTLAFEITIPAGFDQWKRQVYCFIRNGLYVTRLLDSTYGPSNNVADLLQYLITSSSRLGAGQIDAASFLAAARFTNANGYLFNGLLNASSNVRDWMSNTLPYFLLREVRINGKEGLKPLLPTNGDGTISTGAVEWEFTFSEEHIVPGSFRISYTPLADRKPICVVVLWRQQPEDDIGLIRSSEIRYVGTAPDGPYEQHDLSNFCTTEAHAIKVGAYILARRRHVRHTLSISVKPDSYNATLTQGDLVRVRLDRQPSSGQTSTHNYIYEVEKIGRLSTGEVQLQLAEFPIDTQLRSIVAQEVVSATSPNILFPTGRSGVSCDENLSTDLTIPADTSLNPGDWTLDATDLNGNPIDFAWDDATALDISQDALNGLDSNGLDSIDLGSIGLGSFAGLGSNDEDLLGDEGIETPTVGAPTINGEPSSEPPEVGDSVDVPEGVPCDYRIEWRKINNTTGEYTVVYFGEAAPYIVQGVDSGFSIQGVGTCTDNTWQWVTEPTPPVSGLFLPCLPIGQFAPNPTDFREDLENPTAGPNQDDPIGPTGFEFTIPCGTWYVTIGGTNSYSSYTLFGNGIENYGSGGPFTYANIGGFLASADDVIRLVTYSGRRTSANSFNFRDYGIYKNGVAQAFRGEGVVGASSGGVQHSLSVSSSIYVTSMERRS